MNLAGFGYVRRREQCSRGCALAPYGGAGGDLLECQQPEFRRKWAGALNPAQELSALMAINQLVEVQEIAIIL